MNVVSRGIRNAFRNSIRTFSIVVILGISVGLALSMLVARQAVEDKITTVKSSIGNTITISPAGSRGFEGGGEALTNDQMKEIAALRQVTNVSQTLSDWLTTDDTDLESSIEPGSLGNRAQGNSGVGFQAPPSGAMPGMTGGNSDTSSSTEVTRTFTPPVTITGTNDTETASVFGGDSVTFTSGQAFDASKDENKAVLGKAIAEKNGLSVGGTFTAYGETITVVGIYDTGNTFANNGVIVSLATLQRLSGQTGAVTNATSCGGLKRAGAPSACDILPALDQGVAAGQARFGVKTATATNTGSNPTGTLQPVSGSDYNNSTYALTYVSGNATGVTSTYGDPFLDTDGAPVNNKNMELTFAASISNATPAGTYSANLSLIATGKF